MVENSIINAIYILTTDEAFVKEDNPSHLDSYLVSLTLPLYYIIIAFQSRPNDCSRRVPGIRLPNNLSSQGEELVSQRPPPH